MTLAFGVALAAAILFALEMIRAQRKAHRLDLALTRASEDLEHLERAFSRFAPAGVVEKLGQGRTEIPPERREVTHGHVARMMGDGLMALFGALDTNTWQCADGVRAALGMRDALARLNQDLQARGLPKLAFGVGIHRGDVLCGVVGSDELMEFTVMGDVVNVAARVEALTRQHGVDILVTDAVREKLDARFRLAEQPAVAVKGKTEIVRTWAVVELVDAPRRE